MPQPDRQGRSSTRPVLPMLPRRRTEISRLAAAGGNSGGRPDREAKPEGKMKWRLLLPGASGPRLAELNPPGLQTWFFKPLTRPEQPEHSCRLQLLHSPMTAEPYREKTRPLRPRRSCFAPTETRAMQRAWVEAPGAAPGSERFIAAAIYFHSRQAGTLNIERFQAKWRPVR